MLRLILAVMVLALGSLSAADLSGKWTGTMETNGSRVDLYLRFHQEGEGFSGTVATADEAFPVSIENPQVREDGVTFEVRDNAGRMVTFRLKLTDGVLSGEATVGGHASKVSAGREPILIAAATRRSGCRAVR